MNRIHDENRQVLVNEADLIERWKEHFKGLFGDEEGLARTCCIVRQKQMMTEN